MTKRVAILLEYHGGAFFGSQMQAGGPVTVQSVLLDALNQLGLTPTGMLLAGRTDTGVHAQGQVAHFDVPDNALTNIDDLQTALNALLPPTVAVKDCVIGVDSGFHSLKMATHKWYRYVIYLAPQRSVWMPQNAVWLDSGRYTLDIERMQAAARLIQGCHQFTSFQSQTRAKRLENDVCDIIYAGFHQETAKPGQISEFSGTLLNFDIVGNRFLYKMVRNLMGQLLQIGQATPGRTPQLQDPTAILTVLNQHDRTQAAGVAKANGLSLMAVHYASPQDYFKTDPLVQTLTNFLITEPIDYENLFRKAS